MPSRDGAPPAKPAGSPREEGRVRIRVRNPFPPASVASVLSVVNLWNLRIAHLGGELRAKRGQRLCPRPPGANAARNTSP
jgi:hypothetical protein